MSKVREKEDMEAQLTAAQQELEGLTVELNKVIEIGKTTSTPDKKVLLSIKELRGRKHELEELCDTITYEYLLLIETALTDLGQAIAEEVPILKDKITAAQESYQNCADELQLLEAEALYIDEEDVGGLRDISSRNSTRSEAIKSISAISTKMASIKYGVIPYAKDCFHNAQVISKKLSTPTKVNAKDMNSPSNFNH